MELNDCIKVTLTQRGADILNTRFAGCNERMPGLDWKTDYKRGDCYKSELWDICAIFGPYLYWGAVPVFTDLEIDK